MSASAARPAHTWQLVLPPLVGATERFGDYLRWLQSEDPSTPAGRDESPLSGPATLPRLRELGDQLAEIAFRDRQVLEGFASALAAVQRGDQQRRLRLEICTDSPEVAALPWEYLRLDLKKLTHAREAFAEAGAVLGSSDEFLALHPEVELIRRASVDGVSTAIAGDLLPAAGERVRVLLVGESNPGAVGLPNSAQRWRSVPDVRRQIEDIGRKFAAEAADRAELMVVNDRPGDEVLSAIRDFRPHVLHFSGHGALPVRAPIDEPALVLAGPGTQAMYVEATEFTRLCVRAGVRVVVLNCCYLASADPDAAAASQCLTHMLSAAQIPVAVAMQTPILENEARSVAWLLYSWLLDGHSLEAAVRAYRRRYAEQSNVADRDWGGPVVYSNVPDAVLFPAKADRPDKRRDFSRLITEYGFNFVGRGALLTRIDHYVKNPDARILYLSGPAGIGKSAVLAACIRAHSEYVHAFYRYGDFTRPIECARHVLQALDPLAKPPESAGSMPIEAQTGATIGAVGDKLLELARTGRKITIVIDGLDESQSPADALPIPDTLLANLPANVAVVVGARPEWYAQWRARHPGKTGSDSIDADTRFLHVPIEPMGKENIDDTSQLIAQQVWNQGRGVSLARCQDLARLVGGNFLVITVLGDLFVRFIRLDDVESLYRAAASAVGGNEELPVLYRVYLERHVALHPEFEADMPVVRKIIGVIGSAIEAVSFQQIRAVLNAAGPDAEAPDGLTITRGLRHLRRFLHTNEFRIPGDEAGYEAVHVPYHESFAAYARSTIDAKRVVEQRWLDCSAEGATPFAHRWADYCLGWKTDLEHYARHYALRNLPSHLISAGGAYAKPLADTMLDYSYMVAAIGARPGTPRPMVIDELIGHYSDAVAALAPE